MAFILLLLLSVTTLVRVETSASSTALSRVEAQQNALLGAYVALGELQRAVGPDQRVTARAAIFDTNPDTLSVEGVANPHWLGVFRTSQPGSEDQLLEALRAWSNDYTAANRVYWLVSARSDLTAAGADPVATEAALLNGGNASDIITVARYQNDAGDLEDVVAGKLDILSDGGSASGRFAWWVADESAKFRINAVKEDTVLNGLPFDRSHRPNM